MGISKFFPSKELTEKEKLERKFKKDLKKIERKLFLNPMSIDVRMDETINLMDKAIEDGIMTEKEKNTQITKFNNAIEKFSLRNEKFRNFMKKKKS